jgi:cytochrome c biogenesis protein
MASKNPINKLLRTFSSIKTGVVLLILVVIAAAIGTIVLQRPATEADQIERTYSPQALLWLDRLGFTDVYHSWWFATLLGLVATSIILVSVDRFPRAWKVLTKPYKQTDPHFRAVLPTQEKVQVTEGVSALNIAERALRKVGLRSERLGSGPDTSLYAERNRFSVLAVYVIHASLLLIFLGGIIDALYGYKGFLMLTKGQQVSQLDLSDNRVHKLPFTVRFDNGAREDYPDGSPKQWWSQVTVFENGKEVQRKKIEVNDPLVRRGIRFFQSSFGTSEKIDSLSLTVATKTNPKEARQLVVRGEGTTEIDADTTVRVVHFIPDFVMRDNQIYKRSNNPVNPAIELAVTKKGQAPKSVFMFPAQSDAPTPEGEGYTFGYVDGALSPFTGLQVSYEPGQWAVWAGCVFMAIGLGMAFYCVHRRYWAVVVHDPKLGQILWIGTQADKNREHYADEFKEIVSTVKAELQLQASVSAEERTMASV